MCCLLFLLLTLILVLLPSLSLSYRILFSTSHQLSLVAFLLSVTYFASVHCNSQTGLLYDKMPPNHTIIIP